MGVRLLAKTKEHDLLLSARTLYDNYGAMLLGYLFEVMQDQGIAEQYLVDIFNEVAKKPTNYNANGLSTLSQLQILARKKLTPYYQTVKDSGTGPDNTKSTTAKQNKYLSQMTPEQQHVFCSLHYHGKSICMLAVEMQKPEDDIRKILKEAFTLIRRVNGHTGIH
jgi:DNA-directed RNA polymerase specialized sigma24 family protein